MIHYPKKEKKTDTCCIYGAPANQAYTRTAIPVLAETLHNMKCTLGERNK